ncbi:MAG: hypothetical protein ABJZ55_11540 [Fuerstiella sp.]
MESQVFELERRLPNIVLGLKAGEWECHVEEDPLALSVAQKMEQ